MKKKKGKFWHKEVKSSLKLTTENLVIYQDNDKKTCFYYISDV